MLVLALQFSKGTARRPPASPGSCRCDHQHARPRRERAPRQRSSNELMPCAEEQTHMGRLPQNGREDKDSRCGDERRTDPRPSTTLRLTHQCTNWELVRTGPDECRPTV